MRRVFAAAAAAVLVGGACSVGPDVPETASRTPAPAAREGGTLHVGILRPASIDPSRATSRDAGGELVLSVLCDTPISFDPVTSEMRPAIARRFQVTDAGRLIPIRLREGVRLHNGDTVQAEDVTYAMARAAQPELVSPSADLLREVNGYDQLREGRSEGDLLAGARVIAPEDLELIVPFGHTELIRVLGHPITAPLPQDVVRDLHEREADDEFSTQPICAGPYRLAEPWKEGDPQIRLLRFEDYYAQNAAYTAGGAGYVDEIVFHIYEDLGAQLDAFAAGEIDVAHVPEDRLPEARALGELTSTPTSRLDFVGLPAAQPPFDDRVVRIALSVALDRERVNEVVYAGGRTVAQRILPPTVDEGLFSEETGCAVNAPVTGDVERARSMLDDAGISLDGVETELAFNDEFSHRALAEEIGRQWEEAFGLRVALRPMEWEAYLEQGTSPSGFANPFRFSWAAEYPAAHPYLEPLFHSSHIGSTNLTRFGDRRVDRALEREARRATTPEDRFEAYLAIESLVCAQMPIVPVTYGTTHYLFRTERVGSAIGVFTDRSSSRPLLRELFVKGS